MRTAAGEAELPVRVTEHVAEGAVFVPFNQPGFAANTHPDRLVLDPRRRRAGRDPAGELETAEAAAGGEG